MAMTRWEPLRDVLGMQNRMHSLLQEYAREAGNRGEADTLTAGAFVPPVDIYEDSEKVVLTLEVPGIAQDAFQISVENNTLSVSGERQWQGEQKEENYHRVERRYGSFHRLFTLPQTVDPSAVQATYDAGVLRIELGKRPEAKSRQIKVQVGAPGQNNSAAANGAGPAPAAQQAN